MAVKQLTKGGKHRIIREMCSELRYEDNPVPLFPAVYKMVQDKAFGGWVGRKYVRAVSTTKNPAESEIIINVNVPLALKIMATGYIWPISAWQELVSGDLVALDNEVTVSPR